MEARVACEPVLAVCTQRALVVGVTGASGGVASVGRAKTGFLYVALHEDKRSVGGPPVARHRRELRATKAVGKGNAINADLRHFTQLEKELAWLTEGAASVCSKGLADLAVPDSYGYGERGVLIGRRRSEDDLQGEGEDGIRLVEEADVLEFKYALSGLIAGVCPEVCEGGGDTTVQLEVEIACNGAYNLSIGVEHGNVGGSESG